MPTYYLHQTLWYHDANPPTGIFQYLLWQMEHPELFVMSKYMTEGGARPYIEMAKVFQLYDQQENWSSLYFSYPMSLMSPLDTLWGLYWTAINTYPEQVAGDYYRRPERIIRYISLVSKQREFTHQCLNAYLARTRTHHETMYNRAQDAEQWEDTVAGVWKVARGQWLRMA